MGRLASWRRAETREHAMKWETPEALVTYLRAKASSEDRQAAADMIDAALTPQEHR